MTDAVEPKTLNVTCPRCGRATAATILARGKGFGSALYATMVSSYFVECGGCQREFLVDSDFSLQSFGEPEVNAALIRGEDHPDIRWVKCFPIEHFPDVPPSVPPELKSLYEEASASLLSGFPNAAGILFGKILEVATRAEVVMAQIRDVDVEAYKKMWLKKRLEVLKAAGIVPAALFDLVDVIKDERDRAVHEQNYLLEDAAELKRFVDVLLNLIFSLPGQIDAVRRKRELARNAAIVAHPGGAG